ncbi:ssDNA-binding protein [Amorphus orientalis]|nr:ssDNA-binding protein [Amorphus orientalis]
MHDMSDRKKNDPCRVQLKDVRLSFAHLFRAQAFGDGEGEPKFNANFLIDPETKSGQRNLDLVEAAMDEAKAIKWPKGPPKLKEDKLCLRDGSDTEYDGYEGMMFVSANNAKKPLTLDRDKVEVVEADNVLYSGCYVDAIIRVWGQDNKWGKRVNASLEAVRFRRDGDAFGAAPPDPDEFDDIDDDEDDGKSTRRRSRADDDEEDEKPRRRRRSKDDDDDEKPRSRSRRRSRDDDEDDDEDEKPRSRRRSRDDDDDDDDVDRPSRNSRSRRRSRDDDDDDI